VLRSNTTGWQVAEMAAVVTDLTAGGRMVTPHSGPNSSAPASTTSTSTFGHAYLSQPLRKLRILDGTAEVGSDGFRDDQHHWRAWWNVDEMVADDQPAVAAAVCATKQPTDQIRVVPVTCTVWLDCHSMRPLRSTDGDLSS
jgi:hypothetical protein